MAAIAACSLALLAAQAPNGSSSAPPQTAAPPSVISVQTDLILVRVVARDTHGNAVTGLGQSDFQLFDNGKPQAISFFSAENGAGQPATAATPATTPAGAPSANPSTSEAGQRHTALFFDDYHLQFEDLAQTRQAAQGFVTKALSAGDRIGIFTASGQVTLDFTNDVDKLQKTLAQLRSQTIPATVDNSGELGEAVAARIDLSAQNTLGALQNLVLRIAEHRGERRILLVSEGFENRAHQDRLNQIIDAAIYSDITISAMAAYNLDADIEANSQVIEEAAEGTGGVFVHNTVHYDSGFERVGAVAESSYVLGFTPSAMNFDGRFHKLETVVTAHSDWTIEARSGYFAAKPVEPAAGPDLQEATAYNALLSSQDADQQIRLSQDFLKSYPASRLAEPVTNRLIEAYYSKKDWNDFYAASASALVKYPDDVDVLVLSGWVITHLYDPNDSGAAAKLNEAENDLKYAMQLIPALPKPAGLTDEQFAAYKKSEMLEAHGGLGLVYFRQRDYGPSVPELQQAVAGVASPDPTDLWALGIALDQLKRYADAADAFEKCGQLPGDLQDPCKQLARQSEKARNHESMWSPPDVDRPLKSISTTQTCSLPNVLAHAGDRAQELVDNLQRFAAEETIQYQQLDSVGMMVGAETAKYDYLVTFRQGSGALLIDESRQVSAGAKGLTGGPPDHGLPSLALIFHPYFQGDYDMRCEGLADWEGTPAWVVHFVQRKDKHGRMSAVSTSQGAVPANLKGRAWIAADSYQVLHIETDLAEPLLQQRLYTDAVSVNYAPVEFHAQNVQLWLPLSAETFTESDNLVGGTDRSVVKHTFADFVLFSVQSNQTVEKPAQP
jgi:VWFA-related protein